jgi:sugar/nucleoside kinase (ribokinase family)
VAVTHGARGATLLREGREVATALPPRIVPVDTTGAGDTFVAALLVACSSRSRRPRRWPSPARRGRRRAGGGRTAVAADACRGGAG